MNIDEVVLHQEYRLRTQQEGTYTDYAKGGEFVETRKFKAATSFKVLKINVKSVRLEITFNDPNNPHTLTVRMNKDRFIKNFLNKLV